MTLDLMTFKTRFMTRYIIFNNKINKLRLFKSSKSRYQYEKFK